MNSWSDPSFLFFSNERIFRYVTETLIEEQFLREFNASLNRRYKELCLQNRDKEIAFVQKNPFVIDTLLQSDETAHVVKLNLRADFEKCKVIGKQQWKSFKLQREAKRLQLLREIKAALKSDNELLKVRDLVSLMSWRHGFRKRSVWHKASRNCAQNPIIVLKFRKSICNAKIS